MTEKKSRDHGKHLGAAIAILILVVLSPLVLVGVLFYALSGLVLYLAIWLLWCLRGRYVLFVYSDSPIWREYIEREVLPRLEGRAVVLNWSERKRWRKTLAVFAFRYFGGYRAFNPLAVVFRPFHFAKTFRFFEPFQEFKHGKPEKVEQMQTELFELLRAIDGEQIA
jgi:hypothetical protein